MTYALTPLNPASVAADWRNVCVVVSGDSKNVYAGGYYTPGAGLIRWFTRAPDGTLTAAGMITAPTQLIRIVQSPDGKNLYAIGGTGVIAQYARDLVTGALTQLAPAQITVPVVGSNPDLVISPDGKHLYSATNNWTMSAGKGICLINRDTVSGLLTVGAMQGADIVGEYLLGMSADGLYVYGLGVTYQDYGLSYTLMFYPRDPITGALNPIANGYGVTDGIAMVARGNHTIYVTDSLGITKYSMLPGGAYTAPVTITSSATQGLALSPDGFNLYGNDTVLGKVLQYEINPITEALTLSGTFTGATAVYALSVSPDNTSLYAGSYGAANQLWQYKRAVATVPIALTGTASAQAVGQRPFNGDPQGDSHGVGAAAG